MQMKRSRMAYSSSSIDAGAQDQTSTPQTEELRRDAVPAPMIALESQEIGHSRPGILRVSSPEVVKKEIYYGDHSQGQIGNFLESCYFCKKKMLQIDEVFMYGSLRGFCTPECRCKQIAIDNMLERVAKQSRGTGTECSKMNDVKDQSACQLDKQAAPGFQI